MWIRRTRLSVLAALLLGLCLCARANTTCDTENAHCQAVASDTIIETMDQSARTRVALVLPLWSGHLSGAAYAVQAGCEAYQRRNDGRLSVAVVATDGRSDTELQSYLEAQQGHDIIIGPMTRTSASLVLQQEQISRPTIVLTPPDMTQATVSGRQQVLAMGLPIENEAGEMATWLEEEYSGGTVIVVSGGLPWQQRAATALVQQLRRSQIPARVIVLAFNEHGLTRQSRQELARVIRQDKLAGVFAALDVRQMIALRTTIDLPATIYGTSHLNPFVRTGSAEETPLEMLDGIRLVDIPWQLQRDHVMVIQYPQMLWPVGVRPGPELARMYALGIDACMVAAELAAGRRDFDMQGVTGQLAISMQGAQPAIFQRTHMRAVYRQGVVVPWNR